MELEASPLEDISPGLTFQWLFNKRAVAFYALHSSRQLVDDWIIKMIEVSQEWHPNQTIFILNDFSAKDCVVTPYSRQKGRELWLKFPHLKSVSTVVVKPNVTMVLTRLSIRALSRANTVNISFTQDEALIWLKKRIDEYERSKV